MSQENVEIVRRAAEAFNRRDLDHWIEFFDPEIEYHDTPDFPGGGIHLGREAFRRHVESYLDALVRCEPEIEYHDTPDFPGGEVHRGLEALRRHAESYLSAWSDARVKLDVRPVGQQVAGRIRYTGAGRATGIEVETPEVGALYDFRAGRIRRVRQFATYAEALEAAGLSE